MKGKSVNNLIYQKLIQQHNFNLLRKIGIVSFVFDMIYDMLYVTAVWLTPSGSSTVHIYT
jgi:hypothetical protein